MAKKIDKSYDWVQFSQNYLYIARLGCQEILNSKHSKIDSRSKYSYHASDLFIPIFFNIKHGIEIFIKTLKFILAEKLSKNDKKHNVSELFDLLKDEIKKHKIVEVIKEEREKNPNSANLEVAYNNKVKIPEFLDNLEKLILRYYHCEVLKCKLDANFTIEDLDNTAFRYPENNLKININYDEVLKKITDEDVEDILNDVNVLLKNFNELGFVLTIYKECLNKK